MADTRPQQHPPAANAGGARGLYVHCEKLQRLAVVGASLPRLHEGTSGQPVQRQRDQPLQFQTDALTLLAVGSGNAS